MERIRNRIITAAFLLFIGIMAVVLRADSKLLALTLQQDAASAILSELPFKSDLIELNGRTMKLAGTRSYYTIINGISITRDNYNVGRYNPTTTDYEVEQMTAFREYLDTKGIGLLYVSEPAKYIDDAFYTEEFGGESYLNRNTDLFLERIGEAGINYVDLRDNIRKDNLDPLDLFYRTDHHWTVPASKWAAAIVAEKLNQDYGYHIDLSLYEDNQFNVVEYKDAWLGEQGKKVALSYIGKDDYTMMEPLYPTSYNIYQRGGDPLKTSVASGDFGLFINKNIYNPEADPYTSSSWHYAYLGSKYSMSWSIRNENADYGKVLVLGDSYEASMFPFLTLGIQDSTLIVPRSLPEGVTVRSIVEQGDYDTVIIAYAQFMIGSHGDEANANYKMFTLE